MIPKRHKCDIIKIDYVKNAVIKAYTVYFKQYQKDKLIDISATTMVWVLGYKIYDHRDTIYVGRE